MATNHGINVTELDTSLTSPNVAESGIPFVVGIAPIQSAESPASLGVPTLVTSWSEAVEKFGFYDSDWDIYGISEVMYSHFQLYNCSPMIIVNVLDPATMKTAVAANTYSVSYHRATLPGEAINDSGLVVKTSSSAGTALVKDTDYEVFYSGGKLIVELLSTGSAYSSTSLYITYNKINAAGVTSTIVTNAFEKVELCLTSLGVVPDILLAPNFSQLSAVAAVMAAKAQGINGMFNAVAIVDIDSTSGTGATVYSGVVALKNSNGVTDEHQIACWPMCKLGGNLFHLSTQIAGLICSIDSDNEGVPYQSPSNNALQIDSLYLADGTTEVQLTKTQADIMVAGGITTAINFISGWVAWGNYTACYPGNTDVKDYFIPCRRMFNWVGNTLVKSFWGRIDVPMNRRLIDSIINTAENWLSGLVASEYLLGARVEFREDENPTTNLMAGILKLHVYFTPVSPMQELDFVLEYDTSYVTEAFSEI